MKKINMAFAKSGQRVWLLFSGPPGEGYHIGLYEKECFWGAFSSRGKALNYLRDAVIGITLKCDDDGKDIGTPETQVEKLIWKSSLRGTHWQAHLSDDATYGYMIEVYTIDYPWDYVPLVADPLPAPEKENNE